MANWGHRSNQIEILTQMSSENSRRKTYPFDLLALQAGQPAAQPQNLHISPSTMDLRSYAQEVP